MENMKAPVPHIPSFNGFAVRPKLLSNQANADIIWEILPNRSYRSNIDSGFADDLQKEHAPSYLKKDVIFAVSGIFFFIQFLVLLVLYKYHFFEISNQMVQAESTQRRVAQKVNLLEQGVSDVKKHLKAIENKVVEVQKDQRHILLEWKNLKDLESSENSPQAPSETIAETNSTFLKPTEINPTEIKPQNFKPTDLVIGKPILLPEKSGHNVQLQEIYTEKKINSDIIRYGEIKNIL